MPSNTKQYNAKYYNDNKTKLLNNLKIKAQCPLCGKMVLKYYINKHVNLGNCLNNLNKQKFKLMVEQFVLNEKNRTEPTETTTTEPI